MAKERSVDELMAARVKDIVPFDYHATSMTSNEIIKRREAMRKILMNTKFGNSSNQTLDSIRLEKIPFGYIVEDEIGAETILGYSYENGKIKAGFRNVDEKAGDEIPFKS